eukprot:scaffold198177_cov19-Tisochrysis_lutea.AAC.1
MACTHPASPYPRWASIRSGSFMMLIASFYSSASLLEFPSPNPMQGLCEERQLNDFDGSRYHIAHVSRRGRLHVGPRYKARGLNDCAEPGNEIECELVRGNTVDDIGPEA